MNKRISLPTHDLTAAEARALQLAQLTEEDFLREVIKTAKDWDWDVYHTRFSISSRPGFPDLVLVRPPRVVFAELKRIGGKTTERQDYWLALLNACQCETVETHLWTPADYDAIYRTLAPDGIAAYAH